MPVLAGLIFVLAAVASPASAFGALTVFTNGAANVDQDSATLNLSVSEGIGAPIKGAQYGFEYGTTTAYGSEAAAPYVVPPGTYGPVHDEITVNNLTAATTYHYRAAAIDYKGNIVYGADATFTTPPPPTFQADQYAAALSGVQVSSGDTSGITFTTEAGKIWCKEVSVAGALTEASTALSLSPAYPAGKCEVYGWAEGAVKANGCAYVFHAPAVTGGSSTMDISCPGGSSIEVISGLQGSCVVSIPAQTGLSSVAVSNFSEPSQLSLQLNVSKKLKYTVVKDGIFCPYTGTGERQDGSFTGKLTVGATKAGKAIGLRLK